jgi:hypothetical protein
MLTVLSDRNGNVALLMAVAWMIEFGSVSFVYCLEFISFSVEIELISFLVLVAITICAQIHFFFMAACSNGCTYSCSCSGTFFCFGYCGSLLVD